MGFFIGIFVGIMIAFCLWVVLHYNDCEYNRRAPSCRADKLPALPKTDDVREYQDNVCKRCSHFDGHDMCLRREHWGTIIQNTVEYCKLRQN